MLKVTLLLLVVSASYQISRSGVAGLPCKLVLPQFGSTKCREIRKRELHHQRMFYRFTNPPSPNDPDRKLDDLIAPQLNQTESNAYNMFMVDPFSAHWFNLWALVLGRTIRDKIHPQATQFFRAMNVTNYHDYNNILQFYSNGIKAIRLPKYFKFTSDLKYIQDIIRNNKWKEDKYFVQQRLAGLNPWSIQAVTRDCIGVKWENLRKHLNPTFKWLEEIEKVVGEHHSLEQILTDRLLYVVQFPLVGGLPTAPDLFAQFNPKPRVMKNVTSPVAVFAVCKKKSCRGELKAVAIQIDRRPDAEVVKPSNGYKWELAKLQFQMIDAIYTHVHNHLLRTHFKMEPACVTLERHLSYYHPLHQILKFHCRGTLAVNINAVPSLLGPQRLFDQLTAIGRIGLTKIFNDGYLKMHWGDNDIYQDIKTLSGSEPLPYTNLLYCRPAPQPVELLESLKDCVSRGVIIPLFNGAGLSKFMDNSTELSELLSNKRGLDNKKVLRYYPYRDDGTVLDSVVKRFSRDLINLYYISDADVMEDYELQNMINELSSEGNRKPYGGNGKVKGLPPKLANKRQLAKFVGLIIWTIIQHSAVNYPVTDLAGYTVISPSKLYSDPRATKENNTFYNLPDKYTALGQAGLTISVGTLHYDKLFDYSTHLDDEAAKKLVSRYYKLLKTKVQPLFEERRRKRLSKGQLTYPYMDPSFITNSISV